MQKINVAVIGVGHLGSHHAAVYKELDNANLVAVCDVDHNRLKQVSEGLGIKGYSSYKDLFDKVQAISLAVPTHLHYKIAAEFLEHKIHTLVEKPFTTDLKQADDLIKIADHHDLILQVGHIERFNSAFSATRKIINQPRFIECHRLSPFPKRSLDVGVILDLMIHDIDIILGLVNSPVSSIHAVGINVLTNFEDIANARISFQNGCVCNLTASRISEEWMRKIRIFQKNTYISLDYKNEHAFIYKKIGPLITKKPLPIEREEPLKNELAAFLECIDKHREPLVSGKIAREALAVALEIQKKIW